MSAESHSEELARELRNCQTFLTDAQNNGDATRSIQLLRVFAQLHRDIEKAKIREEKYLDEKQVAAHDAKLMSNVIDKFQKYMRDLYTQTITPETAWQQLVDELLGES